MKLKPKHIKRFEAFIQNSKDPNADENPDEDTGKTKKDKQPNSSTDEDETKDSDEEEKDPLEEMKRYHTEWDKKYKHLWTSSI
jgi:hypothetical protein